MRRARRARRLQVLVRGSVQPVVATAVVPGAVSGADSAGAPAISTVLPAQTASARAAVACACSSLTIVSASASALDAEAETLAGVLLP